MDALNDHHTGQYASWPIGHDVVIKARWVLKKAGDRSKHDELCSVHDTISLSFGQISIHLLITCPLQYKHVTRGQGQGFINDNSITTETIKQIAKSHC